MKSKMFQLISIAVLSELLDCKGSGWGWGCVGVRAHRREFGDYVSGLGLRVWATSTHSPMYKSFA